MLSVIDQWEEMTWIYKVLIVSIFSLALFTVNISAQRTDFGIYTGLSKDCGGYDEFLKRSPHIAGSIHFEMNRRISLGMNISYVWWGLVEGNDIADLSYGSHWETSGKARIYEFAPSLKIRIHSLREGLLKFHGLLGLGYYVIDYDIKYYDPWLALDPNFMNFGSDNAYLRVKRSNLGLYSGLNISMKVINGVYLSVEPKYRIVIDNKNYIKYASVNIGLSYNL